MKIYAASDHAGWKLRRTLVAHLRAQGVDVADLGPETDARTDYPDHAAKVARAVTAEPGARGLLVCGSGVGMCMAANKVRGIRAVDAWNVEAARLSREHNDANVLCLGERLTAEADAIAILDAWLGARFEGGRHADRVAKITALEHAPLRAIGSMTLDFPDELSAMVAAERGRLDAAHAGRRIWDGDPSFFTPNPTHAASIRERMGWLRAPSEVAALIPELRAFVDEVRAADLRQVVLLGMGGSSLCPEVLAQTFGARPGYLPLIVLDNTDPAAIRDVEDHIDLSRTLFIVASKSGGTLEVKSFERHFWKRVVDDHGGRQAAAGEHFVAITDPGTPLAALAAEKHYRRTFLCPADVGGRYSALTGFGLLPAALLGVDLQAFVDSSAEMARACAPESVANPGLDLGAALGALAKKGRDKLTFVFSPEVESFGSWLEQLVAESTGKDGKGIVPVDLEPPGAIGRLGTDRVFAFLRVAGGGATAKDAYVDGLRAAGHPVVRIDLPGTTALGGEIFRWEMATVVAGACLGVDPFDEPNVTEAKEATAALLAEEAKTGRLPAPGPAWVCPPDAADVLGRHIAQISAGDYFALCAYFLRTPARDALLAEIRRLVCDRKGVATTLGYGPRFLHSTGQLHKGGAGNGVFLQITADGTADLPIPGERFSFATLRNAQALGDLRVLHRRGRRVLRVHLGAEIEAGLARLAATLGSLRS